MSQWVENYIQRIGVNIRLGHLKKTMLLGNAWILRKVLESWRCQLSSQVAKSWHLRYITSYTTTNSDIMRWTVNNRCNRWMQSNLPWTSWLSLQIAKKKKKNYSINIIYKLDAMEVIIIIIIDTHCHYYYTYFMELSTFLATFLHMLAGY